jgi:hypothetical protein
MTSSKITLALSERPGSKVLHRLLISKEACDDDKKLVLALTIVNKLELCAVPDPEKVNMSFCVWISSEEEDCEVIPFSLLKKQVVSHLNGSKTSFAREGVVQVHGSSELPETTKTSEKRTRKDPEVEVSLFSCLFDKLSCVRVYAGCGHG